MFRHAIFHHFNHTIQGFGTWSCGQEGPRLTSWPVGVLAVYHCPTPSAFVPWSKDLEAEDPEKFGSQNPCMAMTHIFSEVKGMEILGDWRYKYVKLTNCFKFHIDMTSMQLVHEKKVQARIVFLLITWNQDKKIISLTMSMIHPNLWTFYQRIPESSDSTFPPFHLSKSTSWNFTNDPPISPLAPSCLWSKACHNRLRSKTCHLGNQCLGCLARAPG